MAAIRSNGDGVVLQVLADLQQEQENPAGSDIVYILRIDENTNGPLLADVASHISDYTLFGTELRKNGNLIAPNPPGQAFADIKDSLPLILPKMGAGQSLNTVENNAAMRIVFRHLGLLE